MIFSLHSSLYAWMVKREQCVVNLGANCFHFKKWNSTKYTLSLHLAPTIVCIYKLVLPRNVINEELRNIVLAAWHNRMLFTARFHAEFTHISIDFVCNQFFNISLSIHLNKYLRFVVTFSFSSCLESARSHYSFTENPVAFAHTAPTQLFCWKRKYIVKSISTQWKTWHGREQRARTMPMALFILCCVLWKNQFSHIKKAIFPSQSI